MAESLRGNSFAGMFLPNLQDSHYLHNLIHYLPWPPLEKYNQFTLS